MANQKKSRYQEKRRLGLVPVPHSPARRTLCSALKQGSGIGDARRAFEGYLLREYGRNFFDKQLPAGGTDWLAAALITPLIFLLAFGGGWL